MTHSGVLRVFSVILLTCAFVHSQSQLPVANESSATSQKPAPATISGRVVSATNGMPLKKATILAMMSQAGQSGPVRPKSTTTDADGNFLLKDLDPGRYMLSVTRSGYARQYYGQRVPLGPGTEISVIAGQQIKDILFRMIPAGVIAGRIVDEDGEPVYQARVEAQRWMYVRGKRQLIGGGFAMTNDLGEYRLAQLAPGHYFVSATFPAMVVMPGGSGDSREGYSQTFYPGVYDSAQADPIEVKGGAEVGGINLRLVPMRAVHVRGVVIGGKVKEFGLDVRLIPKGRYRPTDKFAMPDEHGAFDMEGVVPGTYTILADSFADEKRMFAQQTIEVADSDIDGITLLLKPGADIPGRLRLEGNVPVKDSHIRVSLFPEEFLLFGGMPAVPDDNMTFTLKGYSDGDYRLSVFGLPEDTYIKSATVGSRDILEDGYHLAGAVRPLEIVISANGGRVEGVVTDNRNNPFAGARVVLVPDEAHRRRQELFKSANTDQYGRFTLRGVAPGTYTIYAWESIDEGAYMDPDFLKTYADTGKSIQVSESSRISADLKVIPAATAEGN